MVQLSRMSSLETLDVSYCPMGNAELVTIAAGCPNLVYMNLDGCWISTLCMLGVVRRRPTLRLWHTGTLEHGPIKVTIHRRMSSCACLLIGRAEQIAVAKECTGACHGDHGC